MRAFRALAVAELDRPVTASFGVASCPADATEADARLAAADAASYAAKRGPRSGRAGRLTAPVRRLRSAPKYGKVPRVLAYLDPGTGSMLVQLLVGGVAAVAVTAKFYWRRLLSLFRFRKDKPELRSAESDRDG